MKWQHVAYVDSDGEPGKTREIKRHPTTGALGCDCPAYRFQGGAKHGCKHVRAFQAGMLSTQLTPRQVAAAKDWAPVRVEQAGETFTFRRAIAFGSLRP